MEMKRRSFIKTLTVAGSFFMVAGLKVLADVKPVKKLLYAMKIKKYPGKIKQLGKINQSDELLG
jgi:hypothetical protein